MRDRAAEQDEERQSGMWKADEVELSRSYIVRRINCFQIGRALC